MANLHNIGLGDVRPGSSGIGVSNNSDWYNTMYLRWKKVNALLGGTDTMRGSKETFLPQFPLEGDDFYLWRINTAVLTNFFKHMADQMVGKIFTKQVEVDSPIPLEILNDIDRQGTNIQTFARHCAFDIITKGMSHIFVDYPKLDSPITARQVKERNIRPFWVKIPPESLFAASTSKFNDSDDLSQVRWSEIGTDVYEFEEREYERIRVVKERLSVDDDGKLILNENDKPIVEGMEWQIWEQNTGRIFPPKITPSKTRSSGGYVMVDSGELSLNKIPLSTAFANRTGFYTSSLPLEDVAFLNILHWQQASDLNNIIRLSQAPLLFAKGLDDAPEAKGGNVVFHVTGTGEAIQYADMKYVEPGGDSIEAGERALERIVRDAQMIGMRMFERSRSVETATGEQLEKIEDASPLQIIAMELEGQLKRALDFTCDWLDLPKENSVKVNKDFAFTGDESDVADHVSLMYTNGSITLKTYIEHMKELGILKQTVNVETEATEATKEFQERQNSKTQNNEIKSKEGLIGAQNNKKIEGNQ